MQKSIPSLDLVIPRLVFKLGVASNDQPIHYISVFIDLKFLTKAAKCHSRIFCFLESNYFAGRVAKVKLCEYCS